MNTNRRMYYKELSGNTNTRERRNKGPVFLRGKETKKKNKPVLFLKGNYFYRKYPSGFIMQVIDLGKPNEREVPIGNVI